ncbi:hypothetical protein CHS0354_035800, partial [Potamilus streckersoni]
MSSTKQALVVFQACSSYHQKIFGCLQDFKKRSVKQIVREILKKGLLDYLKLAFLRRYDAEENGTFASSIKTDFILLLPVLGQYHASCRKCGKIDA